MDEATVMDLGKYAGMKANRAVEDVAQLVDELKERIVLQTYAASMVATTMVATAVEVARLEKPDMKVDEKFVEAIMSTLTKLVVCGVMLGQQRMAAE